jgi:tRNA/rRNA methyltransferase
MWNFGLDRMRLVAPRDGWPNPKAAATASGAGRVLDGARVFEDTAAAVADLGHVYATTARPRELTKRVLTPEAAMREAAELIAAGERVGILYGPERTGLENADVVLASAVVTVPVNPAFASLNLAQCVLLMSYEWRLTFDETPAEQLVTNRAGAASAEDVGRMIEHLVGELDRVGFFHPEAKRPSMLANLENLFRRASLTDQEVRTLRGVIRALAEGRSRAG